VTGHDPRKAGPAPASVPPVSSLPPAAAESREHLTGHVSVRFPELLAGAAARLAERDGMTASAWIRSLAEREVARQSGKCPACGHEAGPADRGEGE
jgi:hypothetical protein